ncbi:MAG: type II toxin-antitoxin system RelE/ParE family toxin [Ruminococcus sp.]|nr:type II toxin-antitoxin system RelE/ParE family toxin [Ruminococcus sp.]
MAKQLKEPQTAAKLIKRIRESIKELKFSLERFIRLDFEPWYSMNMRHFPVGNYEVYYIVDKDTETVTIVRIFYGGRDVETMLNDIN